MSFGKNVCWENGLEIAGGTPPFLLVASSFPIPVGECRSVHTRISSQMRSCLLPDSFVSRPRFVRVWEQMRVRLAPRALTNLGSVFSLSAGPTGQPCAKDRRALRKSRKDAVGKAAKLVGHREARRRFLGFVLPCQSLPKNRNHSCSKLGVKKPICIRSRMSVREKKRPSATSSDIFGLAWVRVVNTCTSSRSRLLSNT